MLKDGIDCFEDTTVKVSFVPLEKSKVMIRFHNLEDEFDSDARTCFMDVDKYV
jgi:hypothetical protein